MRNILLASFLLGFSLVANAQESLEFYLDSISVIEESLSNLESKEVSYHGQSSEGGYIVYYPESGQFFAVLQYGELGKVERRFYRFDSSYFVVQVLSKYNMPFHFEGSEIVEIVEEYFFINQGSVKMNTNGQWIEDYEANYLVSMSIDVNSTVMLNEDGRGK